MNPESLFSLAGAIVLPGWLLLAVLPRWRWTATLVSGVLLPGVLGLLYAYILIAHWGSSEGGFGSLAEVSQLFANPWLLLAGWVHYLAFDLFIGAWEVRDAQRLKIHHLLVAPCLFFTFVFGPVGLLLYLALRGVLRRRVPIAEDDLATIGG